MSTFHQSHHHHRSHIVCKFYSNNGYCRWGDRCNFSHTASAAPHGKHPTFIKKRDDYDSNGYNDSYGLNSSVHVMLKPHCPSLNIMKANFTRSSLNLLSTKPLLHVVILYAGDINVRRYVAELMPKFLQAKIHCFVQMNTPVSTENEDIVSENDLTMEDIPNMNCSIIKPEHLLQIITGSNADFLVVIGDRNMKQKTCQSKRNGKLIPSEIDEEIKRITDEWSIKKVKNPLDHIVASGVENVKKDDILKLFQWITNVRHIKARVKKLSSEIKDLSDWYTSIGDSPESALLGNEERLKELTRLQNASMRIHREVNYAKQAVLNIPADDAHPVDQNDGLDLTYITDFYCYQIGVSTTLKERLLDIADVILHKIEAMCKDFSVFPNKGPLWKSYYDEYVKESSELQMVEDTFEKLPPKYWNLDHGQRSRSSSNVSRADSENSHATHTERGSTSSANVTPTPTLPVSEPIAWKQNAPAPTSYSSAVISSLTAEFEQTSIHNEDSSLLSKNSSDHSKESFQSSSYPESYLNGPSQVNRGGQMGTVYGGTLPAPSSLGNSSVSSPSISPLGYESNTWQGLSNAFDGRQGQNSLLNLGQNNYGQHMDQQSMSYLDQQSTSHFHLDSASGSARANQEPNSHGSFQSQDMWSNNYLAVSRFANNSQISQMGQMSQMSQVSQMSQAPGLFSNDSSVGGNGVSRGYMQTPFMSSTTTQNEGISYHGLLLQNTSTSSMNQSNLGQDLGQSMNQGRSQGMNQGIGQHLGQMNQMSQGGQGSQGMNQEGRGPNGTSQSHLAQGGMNQSGMGQGMLPNIGQQFYSVGMSSGLMSNWSTPFQQSQRYTTQDEQNLWRMTWGNSGGEFSSPFSKSNSLDK